MNHPGDFTIPAGLGISILDFDENSNVFEDENDMAVAAPAPAPFTDYHYVGIVRSELPAWQFLHGPFIVRSTQVWDRLRKINPRINSEVCYFEFLDTGLGGRFPTSLDDFIDLIEAPAESPVSLEGLMDALEEQEKWTKGEEWKDTDIDIHKLGEDWKEENE